MLLQAYNFFLNAPNIYYANRRVKCRTYVHVLHIVQWLLPHLFGIAHLLT